VTEAAALTLLLTKAPLSTPVLLALLGSILLGYWSHLALDCVNSTGMPLFLPFTRRRFRGPFPPLALHTISGKTAEILIALVCWGALLNWLLLPALSAAHFALPHHPF
jgi:membrane-bound metal-dependent hydrolase YbcI (DUF457 family)